MGNGLLTTKYLIITIVIMVTLVELVTLVQGFFIAVARLDSAQAVTMIYPVNVYIIPIYYYSCRWLSRHLSTSQIFYSIVAAIITMGFNFSVNALFLKLPHYYTFPSIYIITSYLSLAILGGIVGKRWPKK